MSGPALLQLSRVVIDLVHRVARLPALGEDVEATDVIVTAGGGFNAMVAARRFGIDVAYGGPIGTGAFADWRSRCSRRPGYPCSRPGAPNLIRRFREGRLSFGRPKDKLRTTSRG